MTKVILIDMATVNELKNEITDGVSLFDELFEIYAIETAKYIATLQRAVDENDLLKMGQTTHTLKSSSASIGAIEVSRICCELEKLAIQKSISGVKELFKRLCEAQKESIIELSKELSKQSKRSA